MNANDPYPIDQFLEIRSATHPSFSADGRSITFLMDTTGTPQVWQVELDASCRRPIWPEQVTFHAERVMDAQPSPTEDQLIYTRDLGGDENAQLFLISPTGVETCLTANYESAKHIFGAWSPDGRQLLFASNRRDPLTFDLYLQPLGGTPRLVWQNDLPGLFHRVSFSPDGLRAIAIHWINGFQHLLIEIDLASGQTRQLTPAGDPIAYQAASFAPDGRSLLLLTDQQANYFHIARLDLESGEIERVVAPPWDVESMAAAPNGRYLAYSVNVDGISVLYLLELATGIVRQAPCWTTAPGVIARINSQPVFAPNSEQLAFSFSSATRSSDIYCWDLQTDSIQPVTRVSHARLPRSSFRAPELIRYPTFDCLPNGERRQIPAWFYRPDNARHSMPVVVLVHGGPEYQARPHFDFFVQYLLQRGYAVLAPNVRGSTGYGADYGHLDDGRKRMDSVADLAHAAHWLKRQPDVDGDRLAVLGASYGGFMVLSALTTYPELWAAGVDLVGISNFVTFLEKTSPYRRAAREAEYGYLAHDRDFLTRISPLHQADRITAPLMVIHGANDPRVPLDETMQLVRKLEANHVPAELLLFDDEGHGVVKLKNKRIAYPRIANFLDRNLAGGPHGPGTDKINAPILN